MIEFSRADARSRSGRPCPRRGRYPRPEDMVPDRRRHAEIAFSVTIMMDRVGKPSAIEKASGFRLQGMARMMNDRVSGVAAEHAHRQTRREHRSECEEWYIREEDDQSDPDERRQADIGV